MSFGCMWSYVEVSRYVHFVTSLPFFGNSLTSQHRLRPHAPNSTSSALELKGSHLQSPSTHFAPLNPLATRFNVSLYFVLTLDFSDFLLMFPCRYAGISRLDLVEGRPGSVGCEFGAERSIWTTSRAWGRRWRWLACEYGRYSYSDSI
jgi:hypothetical protein